MRPNILFIMADQFRADAIGCVGGYARTPNLDELARTGPLFTNAYANSAECIPSRISLATGLYPHQTGIDKNTRCTLNPDFRTWIKAIKEVGYQTSLFGKTHFHPHKGDLRDRLPFMHGYGFDVVDETAGPRSSAAVRSNMTDLWAAQNLWEPYKRDLQDRLATKAFMAKPSVLPLELYYDCYVGRVARTYFKNLTDSAPWFCCVSFGGPHEPWDAPEPYASMYSPADMPLPRPRTRHVNEVAGRLKVTYESSKHSPDGLSNADIAAMRANYAGNVTLIDDEIGRIFDEIRRRGEWEQTLIVFTSDHGEMNGDHGLIYKANFLDPAIKIPLIISLPQSERAQCAGLRVPGLVELMDVGATLADYAGASLERTSSARSLRGLLENGSYEHRVAAISEFAGHTCAISADLKVEFDTQLDPVLVINRAADPLEQYDLSHESSYRNAIDELRSWLSSFRTSTPTVSTAVL